MVLVEVVEDAFLAALEEGANPPRAFEVQLPREAFTVAELGATVEIAGYSITLVVDK